MDKIYPQTIKYCDNVKDCSDLLFMKDPQIGFTVAYFPSKTNCTYDLTFDKPVGLSYEGINSNGFVIYGSDGFCDRADVCIYEICKASMVPTVKFVRIDMLPEN
jgi:hypothetical protein